MAWYDIEPNFSTNISNFDIDLKSYIHIYSGSNYSEFLIEVKDVEYGFNRYISDEDYVIAFKHFIKIELGINASIETKRYGSKGQEENAYILKIKSGSDAAFFNLQFNEKIKPCCESDLYYRGKKLRERIFK